MFFVYVSGILRLEQSYGGVHSQVENVGQKRVEKKHKFGKCNLFDKTQSNYQLEYDEKKKRVGFTIKFITIIAKFFSENELISYNPN